MTLLLVQCSAVRDNQKIPSCCLQMSAKSQPDLVQNTITQQRRLGCVKLVRDGILQRGLLAQWKGLQGNLKTDRIICLRRQSAIALIGRTFSSSAETAARQQAALNDGLGGRKNLKPLIDDNSDGSVSFQPYYKVHKAHARVSQKMPTYLARAETL